MRHEYFDSPFNIESPPGLNTIVVDPYFVSHNMLRYSIIFITFKIQQCSKSFIAVTNNTEYTLVVRYSGPDTKKIILKPNESTTVYLSNGYYKVAASVNAADVRNFAGNYNLEGGEYSKSFYIKTERDDFPSWYNR